MLIHASRTRSAVGRTGPLGALMRRPRHRPATIRTWSDPEVDQLRLKLRLAVPLLAIQPERQVHGPTAELRGAARQAPTQRFDLPGRRRDAQLEAVLANDPWRAHEMRRPHEQDGTGIADPERFEVAKQCLELRRDVLRADLEIDPDFRGEIVG